MESSESVSTSMSMVSAGLSLLESLNTVSSVSSTSPKMDVLLSHPSMTTKSGARSPPTRRRATKGAKPWFELPLRDAEVEVGGRAQFSAVVKGDPQALVTWLADGTPIQSGGTYRYVKDGDRHILQVPRVHRQSECIITCKAVNQLGETSSTAKLIIRENVYVPVKHDANTTPKSKHDVTRDMTDDAMDVSDTTDATIMPSIEEKRTAMSAMEFEESAITILDAGPCDKSHTTMDDSRIESLFPPLKDFSFDKDQSSASKRGERFVHFSDESLLQEFTIDGSDSSEICSETSSTLSFKHVIVSHDFDWTEEVKRLIREEIDNRERERREQQKEQSEATTEEQNSETETTHPPKFTKPVCDCVVTAGETAHFVYILDTTPPTAITWQRNGVEVTRNNDAPNVGIIEDDEAGCLLISNVTQSDSGFYSCTAENIHGSSKCFARLVVNPNLSRTSRSTSTFGETAFVLKEKAQYRDQMSQTIIYTRNKGVNSESSTEPPREINDDETGEGGRHCPACSAQDNYHTRDCNHEFYRTGHSLFGKLHCTGVRVVVVPLLWR